MGTIVVLVVLILIVALIIRSMIRDKKNGKSVQCGFGEKAAAVEVEVQGLQGTIFR